MYYFQVLELCELAIPLRKIHSANAITTIKAATFEVNTTPRDMAILSEVIVLRGLKIFLGISNTHKLYDTTTKISASFSHVNLDFVPFHVTIVLFCLFFQIIMLKKKK